MKLFGRMTTRGAPLTLLAALLVGTVATMAPALAQETIAYSYDGQGRLVKVARSGTINNGKSECYVYDAAGNRSNLNVATSGACVQSSGVSFSISSNAAVTEGTGSVFTITKSGTATTSLTVNYATANGTAVAPGDYTAVSPAVALTFTTAQTSKTVTVPTIDDTVVESAEAFTMSLSAPSGGSTIGNATATATVNDNDSGATCTGVSFSIASNAAVTEGTSSVFTISKSGTASGSCAVSYATANGTAAAPGDYTAKSLTALTFTSAQTSQTVSVTTVNDTLVESAETFSMSLSGPTSGATLGTPSTATATINDNDSGTGCSGVSFAVNNAGNDEGLPVVFTITKSGSTTSSCSVNYATADGTAVGGTGADYTITSGTLTFLSSETSKTVSVTTRSDIAVEPDDTFYLNLSAPSDGASLSDAQGLGTIYNDDVADPCPLCRTSGTEPTSSEEPVSDVPVDATEPPPPGRS